MGKEECDRCREQAFALQVKFVDSKGQTCMGSLSVIGFRIFYTSQPITSLGCSLFLRRCTYHLHLKVGCLTFIAADSLVRSRVHNLLNSGNMEGNVSLFRDWIN